MGVWGGEVVGALSCLRLGRGGITNMTSTLRRLLTSFRMRCAGLHNVR